jgi:hypothetical protein
LPKIIDKPVFILGNPRSGTSLLRLMITAHSRISIPPESGFLVWWYQKYKEWSKADSDDKTAVNRYIADLKTSKKIETWNLDYTQITDLILTTLPENYSQLSSLVYTAYSLSRNKDISIWGDKNNYYIAHLKELAEIYPDAYYIHIIRDGRDVACSYIDLANLDSSSPYKPKLSTEITDIAEEWSKNNLLINSFLNQVSSVKGLVVKYEDLIENPANCLRSVCSFLSLPYEEAMMHFYETEKEPKEFTDWKKKTLAKPDPSNKNKYMNLLSQEDIRLFNKIATNTLSLYGYSI